MDRSFVVLFFLVFVIYYLIDMLSISRLLVYRCFIAVGYVNIDLLFIFFYTGFGAVWMDAQPLENLFSG